MNNFRYDRTWQEIEDMLDSAERHQNHHEMKLEELKGRKMPMRKKNTKMIHHAKQFKALQGVVKTLRWVLGDKEVDHPLN